MAPRLTLKVENVRQVLVELDQLDKAAEKIIRKAILTASKDVAGAARKRVTDTPLSGWGQWVWGGRDLSFDPGKVAAGFKASSRQEKRNRTKVGFSYKVKQMDPAGAIFEVMGDKSRAATPGTSVFVDNVVNKHPRRRPRTLFGAYYEVLTPEYAQKVRDQIMDEGRRIGLV